MITLKMDNYRIVDGFELYVRCAGITDHFVIIIIPKGKQKQS
jgi:hypothetical protein